MLVLRQRQAQPVEQRLEPAAHDELAELLVAVRLVEQREQREQRHLDLLRQRQPGGVVQRDHPAVRHHAVDELHLLRLERDAAVTVVERGALLGGQLRDHLVEDVVLVDRDHAEAPAGAAEMLGVGVDADRVLRQLGHRRTEAGHERPVHVVGDDDQVGLASSSPASPAAASSWRASRRTAGCWGSRGRTP